MDLLCHSRRFCCGCPCPPLCSSAFSVFLVFVPPSCFFWPAVAVFFLWLTFLFWIVLCLVFSLLLGLCGSFFSFVFLLRFFTTLSLGSQFSLFVHFLLSELTSDNFSTLSAHQIAIRAALALYLRADRSSNLCPNSLPTNSSELSAHQMACRCCSMRSSCFPAVLVFFSAFFFSFATWPVASLYCGMYSACPQCARLLVFVLFECLVYCFFVCSLAEGPLLRVVGLLLLR